MTRRGTLLVAGALLATACSGTTSEPTTTTTPPTTAAVATTTTVAPTTTSLAPVTTTEPPATTATVDPLARPDVLVSNFDRDSADDFDTTGDDLYRIMLELQDLFNFFEGNPTASATDMVSLLFESAYPFWSPILSDFELLSDNPGWHYVDAGIHTVAIEVLDLRGDIANIRLVDERGNQRIADAEGKVVLEFAGWDRAIGTVTLRRGEDGRWRFFDLTPSVPVSDEEVATMVQVDWKGRS